jgi:tetratricopeptide (TPR) repeat protein
MLFFDVNFYRRVGRALGFFYFFLKLKNKIMKQILILILLLLSFNGFAQNDYQAAFQRGNEAFTAKNYERAADIYEQILAKEQVSFELYFNLGNAYFRLNEIPKAILNYERALQIKPNQKETLYNLKLANQRTIDQISTASPFFLINWWVIWRGLFSSTVWSILAIIAVFTSILGCLVWLFGESRKKKKIGFLLGVVFFVFGILFCLTAWQRFAYEQNSNMAILFAKETPLKLGADNASPDVLLLHEGTKVEILGKTGLWNKVRLPNGEQGWLPVKSLVKI